MHVPSLKLPKVPRRYQKYSSSLWRDDPTVILTLTRHRGRINGATQAFGGVSEWTIVAVLKTAEVMSLRGFESHPLRQFRTISYLEMVFFW